MGSDRLEAKAFKKWVTSEVLPSIRKTGSYGTAPQPVELSRMQILTMAIEAEQAKEEAVAALTVAGIKQPPDLPLYGPGVSVSLLLLR
jgi:prophage antirepressor-like protein